MATLFQVLTIFLIGFLSYQISKLHEFLQEWYSYWKRINQKQISKVGEEETHAFWDSIRENLSTNK